MRTGGLMTRTRTARVREVMRQQVAAEVQLVETSHHGPDWGETEDDKRAIHLVTNA